ncbi:Hypothetical predicted protein, partial [Paramuricea clavata]
MGLASSTRVSTGVVINPSSAEFASSQSISKSSSSSESGSAGLARQEGCSSGSEQRLNRFHKFFVCRSQKRWREPPGSELETLKPIFSVRTLQDGGDSHVKRPPRGRGLSSKDRPQRCLLDSSNLERSPEILALSMERYNARVCMPSLWTGHSSQGLHKIDETCGGHVETEGGAPNYLFRRHFDYGGVRRSSAPPSCFDPESPRMSEARSYKKSEAVSASTKPRADLTLRIIKILGPVNLFYPGGISSPPSLQAPSGLSTLNSYEALVMLNPQAKEEIVWWRDHLQSWNGRALFHKPVDLIIETDASRKGWGAYCEGLRPPEPKYSFTWNVSEILKFIKSLGKNEELDLKLLSFKLVMLLGLTAPDRSSDLAKRDLRYRTFRPEGVSFILPGLSKTSRPGDTPKVSFHSAFPDDFDLCPVECLKFYE